MWLLLSQVKFSQPCSVRLDQGLESQTHCRVGRQGVNSQTASDGMQKKGGKKQHKKKSFHNIKKIKIKNTWQAAVLFMHHWPGPGCWLSRVTREPDTWNSGSGNFLEENSFIFCLDVYPLPKITATSWQRRVFLCLLHTEVAKSFWMPRCICDLLHLCWESVPSLRVSAVCFSGVADIYPHVARALSLPAQNCMF